MKPSEPQTSVVTITRAVSSEEESQYIEIPFEMPEGAEEIHVVYSVQSHGERRAVIDLGVRDSERVRGWSGGARSEFRIGLEKATPGYIPGPLTPGSWAVLHNAYKVPPEGCTITITVKFTLEAPRWLKGDLHMHSIHSDGTYTLEENARIMEELGCDFLAMTDHNTMSQNLAYPRNTSVVMIPGFEFTTNFGHSNFLGVTDPLDDFRVSHVDDVHRRIRTARARGAKIVLNHTHCDYCPWLWGFEVDHDWVEVWNGPWTERNQRSLDWWQVQLASGRRLVAIGGSDTHRPDPHVRHSMPTTWVYSRSKTVGGILEGIGKGHVLISYSPDSPFISLSCGNYMVGDVVPEAAGATEIEFRAELLAPGDLIRLISERGTEEELRVENDSAVNLHILRDGRKFYRAEVWRYFHEVQQTLLVSMTNPIYFD